MTRGWARRRGGGQRDVAGTDAARRRGLAGASRVAQLDLLGDRHPRGPRPRGVRRTDRRWGVAISRSISAAVASASLLEINGGGRGLWPTPRRRGRARRARCWFWTGAGWTPPGSTMGVAELLVHTHDITQGLGVEWRPPVSLSHLGVVDRLLPTPPGPSSDVLLWATGRGDLPGHTRITTWAGTRRSMMQRPDDSDALVLADARTAVLDFWHGTTVEFEPDTERAIENLRARRASASATLSTRSGSGRGLVVPRPSHRFEPIHRYLGLRIGRVECG